MGRRGGARRGGVRLAGYLTVPDNAAGIVVFAHGSGSSRHSPRNRCVARVLNEAGLGTLLFDLLTQRRNSTGPMCSTSVCWPAVVSRGGRPDLARPRLAAVPAPTLLIVGGSDDVVLNLNRRAQAELRCENRPAVAPGATHLFEEPGTLDAAAALARDWFLSHMARSRNPVP